MRMPKLGPGERVRADMTAPARKLVFPLLEAVAYTGLIWMAVGYLDSPAPLVTEPALRNVLVLVWAAVILWRFVLPLIGARRQRFVVTDRRVIARSAGLRGGVDSIPMRHIHSARRYRGGIQIAVYGHDRPLYYPDVGRAKAVESILQRSLGVR